MANIRNILLKVTGDGSDARKVIQDARQDLQRLSNEQAEARINIKTEAFNAQLDQAKQRLDRLSKQEATPKVTIQMARTVEQIERLERKLADLGRKDVKVDVDVGRGGFERGLSGLGSVFSGVSEGAGTASRAVLGMVSALTALGPLAAGAVVAIGALLPIVVLLGASLLSAAAGVGVLAVALAGALGPAVLVTLAALARFAQILLAIKERNDQASGQAKATADAQDQVTAATDSLATAQQNLKAQTTAAWQAYHDAIETVKDDLLSVQQAELGIDQANLNLRKAKEELKDFKGAGEDAVAGIVKKFTDVNVDFDTKALGKAFDGAGVGSDDQLKLEQLILNVRQAALGEKQATDTLSDAKRKLNRDRRTEADFLQRGIKAYDGYRSAVQGVTQAERALLVAQRQQSRALEQQSRLWKDLSPAEQRFARQLERFVDAIRKAFGPSTRSILRGFGRLLESVTDALKNPAVVAGIAVVGQSIGRVFRDWARELRRPEFRRAFRDFSEGAATLIRQLGSNAARSFFRLLLRIGTEALPVLTKGAKDAARWIDALTKKLSTPAKSNKSFLGQPQLTERIPKTPIERFVNRSIDSLRTWLRILRDLGGVLKAFFRAAGGDGKTLADALARTVRHWNNWLNSGKGQERLKTFFHDVLDTVRKIRNVIDKIADALGAASPIVDKLKSITGDPLHIPLLPKITAGEGILGKIFGGRAGGGLVPGAGGSGDNLLASVAGKGFQPLEGGEFVIRRAVVQALGVPALSRLNAGDLGGFAAAAAGGPVHHHSHTNQFNVPGNQTMDPTAAAVIFARELERRGG